MKRLGLILASALLLAIAVVTAGAAADDPLRPKVDALVTGSYSTKAQAVLALAATGDERAVAILNAYMARKLYRRETDGRALVLRADGDPMVFADPLDPKVEITLKADAVTSVRINNRVRGAIGDALATLNLFSKNPDVRRAAADEAFKVRSPRFGPLLRKALQAEKVSDIRNRIKLALAAVLIANGSNTKERVAAIETLADESSPEVVALLRPLMAKTAKGEWAEKDAQVRAAALRVLGEVEERLVLLSFLGDLYRGISLGSVLLLAAIGLAITFGVMGVINMAHGEMVMIGAYTTFTVQEVFRASFPEYFDWSVIVAIPLAFMVAGAVGIAIERGIIQFLYGRPLETLLATWGVSLVLQQAVRSIFGAQNREVGNPSWMSGGFEIVGGVTLTYNR
ncbi:MAG: urea ABC transporter permease subunit UrtB, partial [Bauldia litoralis]